MASSKATWAVGAVALVVLGTASVLGVPPATGPIALGSAPNYRAIVAQNSPAVVGITAEQEIAIQQSPFDGIRGNVRRQLLGSGFIVDPNGSILTNAHLVREAKEVTVKLADRREFQAVVLGLDKTTDIAVLKIDARRLPFVRFGNSDQLKVGDYVLAIGQPYGFEESATAGIVSAKGRSLPGESPVPFIQTDVALNPGNSGGPLFDASGAVVGINSQIFSTTGAYEGLSFAVPINLAQHIKDQIVAHGKAEHARLGAQFQTLTALLAASFRLAGKGGALINSVETNSAAARSDLRAGDVILRYDGQPIGDSGDLSAKLTLSDPGQHITLYIWRDGKPLIAKITLDAAMTPQAAAAGPSLGSTSATYDLLGLAARPLTSEERTGTGVTGGLLVEAVAGRAAQAGIEPGDILLAVNGTPVQSVGQMDDILPRQDKEAALLIQREGVRLFVPVTLN